MTFRYLAVALLFCASSAGAQEGSKKDLQTTLVDSAPYIIARSKVSSPETSKLVYLGLKIKQAYDSAQQDHASKEDTDRRISQAISDGHEYVDGMSFRGGFLEAGLKAAGKVYLSKSKSTFSAVGQNLVDPIVEKGLDALSTPGAFLDNYTDEDLVSVTQWMYSEAAKKDSPLRSYFVTEIRKYHNIEADRNIMFDPSVQSATRFNELSTYLSSIDHSLADIGGQLDDQNVITSWMSTKINSLNGNVTELVKAMNKQKEDKRLAEEDLIQKSNLTGAFGAASAIATLTNNPEAAQKFAKLEKLGGAIYDIAKSDQAFADAPFLVVNPYLFAAVMVVDLLSTSSKDNSQQAIMDALQAIQQQLFELRKLINDRFDRVEYKLDTNFGEIESILETIRSDQAVTRDQLDVIQAHLDRIEHADRIAFEAIGQFLFLELNAKCFPLKESISDDTLRYCWNAYLYLADGAFDSVLKVSSNTGYLSAWQRASTQDLTLLQHLAATFSKLYPAEQPRSQLLDPAQFNWGAFYLKNLKSRYTNFTPQLVTSTVPVPGNRIELDQVVESAVEVQNFMHKMAIGETNELRTDLFRAIFQNYKNSILNIWGRLKDLLEADRVDVRFAGLRTIQWPKGPNVLNFEDEKPIITNAQFAQKEIQTALDAEAPTDPARYIPLCSLSQVTIKSGDRETPLSIPNLVFRFDPAIFNELPGVMRWALLDGVMQARLDACMAKATISNMILGDTGGTGQRPLNADGDFEVDLTFVYNDGEGTHSIPLKKLTARYSFTGGNGDWACESPRRPDLVRDNTLKFPVALWNGGSLVACNGNGAPVIGAAQNNGRLKLVSMPWPNDQEETDFENALQDLNAKYAKLAVRVLSEVKSKALSSGVLSAEAAEQETATLVYTLQNGIGGSSDELQALYNWVLDPTNMPSGVSWVNALLARGVARNTVDAEMEKRETAFNTLLSNLARQPNLRPGYDSLKDAIQFMESNK
jgi:hypothetical protein